MISLPGTAFSFFKPDLGASFASVGNALGEQVGTVHDFITNAFSGERDYNRQKELQDRANAFTASQSAISRDYNARQAQLQRDFEERMSNSAYSRAFADMRKNGINPYAIMSPASTPAGAVASSSGGRGASAYAQRSGEGAMHFLANVVMSAFSLAGKALSSSNKVQAVEFFDRNGQLNGGYHYYY